MFNYTLQAGSLLQNLAKWKIVQIFMFKAFYRLYIYDLLKVG